MKNNIKTKGLLVIQLLVILVAFQGCRYCNRNCSPPDKLIIHHGIFDSIPASTKAVFESNTGKLDTATYGKISVYYDTVFNGRNTTNDCDNNRDIYQYEGQLLDFKNRFGMPMLRFGIHNKADTYLDLVYCVSDNKNCHTSYLYMPFSNSYMSYSDIVQTVLRNDSGLIKGYCICSKQFGLVKINYNDNKLSDTSFTLKYFIK